MDLRSHIVSDHRSLEPTVVIADPFLKQTGSLVSRLTARNYQVIVCSSVGEAMASCLKEFPAFVLTELRLPDHTGLELVRWVSSRIPGARTVVHTWFADLRTAVAAAKAGAEDFVPKPTDEEFLINILLHGSSKIPDECAILRPDRLRREHIEHVVKANQSNVSLAARQLQLDRRSLQRFLKRHEVHSSV